MFRLFNSAAALFLCAWACGGCFAAVYVDGGAPGPVHDGRSWTTAFATIGEGLSAAAGGGEVWVRTGVYHERISLRGYVNIYGGFLGHETSIDQRLPGAFPTVIDAARRGRAVDVERGASVTIDGFTIKRGIGDRGGGIRCNTNSTVNIRNCRVEDCRATICGGGVYYGTYTLGEMIGCTVSRCSAPNGGGMVIEYHSYPTARGCVIARNSADVSGGGMHCPFHSGAYLENCTLAGNTAGTNGGAVYAHEGGPVTLTYCIVAGNSAPVGGGIYGGGVTSTSTITHCDFFSNPGGDWGGTIRTPPPYAGNFSADPVFLLPDRDLYQLGQGSPCAGVGAYPPEPAYRPGRIGLAKLLADGLVVELTGKVVTCAQDAAVYIQEPDRTSAIEVRGITGCEAGDVLGSVTGTLATDAYGLRVLMSASGSVHARGIWELKPLGAAPGQLPGLVGIYTRTWGAAGAVSEDGFALSDGSAAVTVRWPGGAREGDRITATGVYVTAGAFIAQDVTTHH